jgi:hypothetical protein
MQKHKKVHRKQKCVVKTSERQCRRYCGRSSRRKKRTREEKNEKEMRRGETKKER